jgi:hypothetical protein
LLGPLEVFEGHQSGAVLLAVPATVFAQALINTSQEKMSFAGPVRLLVGNRQGLFRQGQDVGHAGVGLVQGFADGGHVAVKLAAARLVVQVDGDTNPDDGE